MVTHPVEEVTHRRGRPDRQRSKTHTSDAIGNGIVGPAPGRIVAGHMTETLAPIVLEYSLACTADIAFAT